MWYKYSIKSMEPIIEVTNISKTYKIRHEQGSYISLRDVIMNVVKNPFKSLKIKAKQVAGFEKREEFSALKDVNFSVSKGEVVGIIGKNGAGKSTLLKILSQITPPSTGEIRIQGRLGSLLEVGTGFHPELTGRENIFLNGAILGMPRKEIARKFDQIVEFAGVTKFLDTPVKYYSSGMYVRLAFSVAAHMEHDILLVDEVLAVGDSEFQKKCLGKMEEVTRQEGRTILFISHNMDAIQKLCTRTIMLEAGKIKKIGPTKEVIDYYLNTSHGQSAVSEFSVKTEVEKARSAWIKKIAILRSDGTFSTQIPISESFKIKIDYTIHKPISGVILSMIIYSGGELLLISSESDTTRKFRDYMPGEYTTTIDVPAYLLGIGTYFFDISIQKPQVIYHDIKQGIYFEITDKGNPRSNIFPAGYYTGKLGTILSFTTIEH